MDKESILSSKPLPDDIHECYEEEEEEEDVDEVKIKVDGSLSSRGAVGISKEIVNKHFSHNERPMSEEEKKRLEELQEKGNSISDQRVSMPAEDQHGVRILTSQGYALYQPITSVQQLTGGENLIALFNRKLWLDDSVNKQWWDSNRALFLFEATNMILEKQGGDTSVVTKMLMTIPFLNRLVITPRLLQLLTGNNGRYVMDTYDVLCHYHALLLASFSERRNIKKLNEHIISNYIEPKLDNTSLTKEILLENFVFEDEGKSVKQLESPITKSTDMKEVYSNLRGIRDEINQKDIIGNVKDEDITESYMKKLYVMRMEATDNVWERLFNFTDQQEGSINRIDQIGDIESSSTPSSDNIPTDTEKRLWALIFYQYELIWIYEIVIMDVLGIPQHGGRKEGLLARRAKADPSFLTEEDRSKFLRNRLRLRQTRFKYMNKSLENHEFVVNPSLEISEPEIVELIEFLEYYSNKINASEEGEDNNNNNDNTTLEIIDKLVKESNV